MPIDSASYTLLSAGWRDLRQVMRVEKLCFLDDAWPLIDILAVLTLPGVVRIKAVTGEDIAGFVSAEDRSGYGWITTIGVIPAYRRQGIARALLVACEDQIRLERIRLCVRRSNLGAQRLYREFGYAQVDVWPRYYRGGEDALLMEKSR
jgi:ribosomal protein S18 acetylase RimI-like enzyme